MSLQPFDVDRSHAREASRIGADELTDAVVLKEDVAYLVAESDGGLALDRPHALGLFREDCRHLSGYELRLGGARLRPLIASVPTGATAVHELTNPELSGPEGRVVPARALRVRLERTLLDAAAMQERIVVEHHGGEPLAVALELTLAADFEPMLALRGLAVAPPRAVRVEATESGVLLEARGGDGVVRSTVVRADPAPASVDGATLRFPLTLAPGGRTELRLAYDLREDGPPRSRLAARRQPSARPGVAGTAAAWLAARPSLRTDEASVDRALRRSLLDLRMLTSSLDGQAYLAAGVPWHATLLGRDSLLAAMQALPFDPSLAEGTLRLLASRQGRRIDPRHEEEPGRILHELRPGELAALGTTPLTRSFGSVDATALFLCALHDHATWTGDLGLFRALRPSVDAALGWIDHFGDRDGDGLLDYEGSDDAGPRHQGWKDSGDGVLDEQGHPLRGPIAVVEAQGYVVRAKRGLAELFVHTGDRDRAARLRHEAAAMVERIERFWLPERDCYAMAIDGHGRPSGAVASNQGHLLWAGAVSEPRARQIRETLMSEAMFSGWGVRTLAEGDAGYDPLGRHLGTVWPHDTALCAQGLRRYGFDGDHLVCLDALLEVAENAGDHRLPEQLAGFARVELEPPVPHPLACRPRAWAAAAIPGLLMGALGLEADGLSGRLCLTRPALPRGVDRAQLRDLRVGAGRADLVFERGADGRVTLAEAAVDGDLELVVTDG